MNRLRAFGSLVLAAAAAILPALARDAMGLVGAALIAFGARLVYEPAGYIVGGVFLVAFAWIYSRKAG